MASLIRRARQFCHRLQPLPSVYGRDFRRIYTFLNAAAGRLRDEIVAQKLSDLKALVAYAEQHVPYYQDSFREAGVRSDDITSLDDFARLPVLEPEAIFESPDRLKSDEFSRMAALPTHTSGTTGRYKALFRSRYQEAFRLAVLWSIFDHHGYHFRDRRASFEAPHVDLRDAQLFDHERIENNLVFNTHHLLAGKYREILDTLRSFAPKMIWGLTNLLVMLADHIVAHNLPRIDTPLVMTFGEKIYPHTRALLQEAFSGTFVDYYGNRENTIGAWGNGDGRFTEISEYCHLEPSHPGEAGDLLSTSLHNFSMPLIRYRVGDIISDFGYSVDSAPRPSFTLVGGRGKDLLLSRDGLVAPYVLTALDDAGFRKFSVVQLEQIAIDHVLMRVVPRDSYHRETDEPLARGIAAEALGERFYLTMEYSDQIPLTTAGKFRPVISDLAASFIRSHTARPIDQQS